jgi:cytoskeletal protein CcmA (bactofilin family)
MKKCVSLTLLTVMVMLAGAWPGWAGDTPCPPHRDGAMIDGDLVVKGVCSADDAEVDGNVKVESGGALTADHLQVGGSVQADGANSVNLTYADVTGDVQLTGVTGASSVEDSVVGGSIQLKDNAGSMNIDDNVVTGDVQAFNNTGGVDMSDNTIDGNLQCKENDPAPTASGGGNTVGGNKEDQCENF